MAIDLRNRVIAITGASAGIGRATALACARAGMDVVVSARRLDRLEEVAAEIESLGRRALAVPCDVTLDHEVKALVNQTMDHLGRLDAVMANAGYGSHASVADMSDEAMREMFETNFFGTMRVIHAALPAFRRQRSGHILITSSCLGRFSMPYHSAYSATKAAQTQIGRAMAIELADERIHVSTIHPITTTTEFFDVSAKKSGRMPPGSPGDVPKFLIQSPERVANAVVRCLRRPRPEVWTSFSVRFAAGVMTVLPRFANIVMKSTSKQKDETTVAPE